MAVLGRDTRLRSAHERASRIALGELEQFASRQKNTPLERRSEITGNICAAAFTHDASRALNPQLHTHFVIADATRDRNGKWYALSEYEMIGAVRYAGKVLSERDGPRCAGARLRRPAGAAKRGNHRF
jgi:conjugative relaxase-like TrwC/TraI family protein